MLPRYPTGKYPTSTGSRTGWEVSPVRGRGRRHSCGWWPDRNSRTVSIADPVGGPRRDPRGGPRTKPRAPAPGPPSAPASDNSDEAGPEVGRVGAGVMAEAVRECPSRLIPGLDRRGVLAGVQADDQ